MDVFDSIHVSVDQDMLSISTTSSILKNVTQTKERLQDTSAASCSMYNINI